MVHAVHHVAGRLRVRNPAIKRCAGAAARYCDVVRCFPGVLNAKANAVTGSVVIEYDPCITSGQGLLGLLGAQGKPAIGRPRAAAEKIAERIGQALVERMIEHSARALIAALI